MKEWWQKIKSRAHKLYKTGPWWKKTLVWIATCIVAFFLFLGAVDMNFLWLFGRSPGFSEIAQPPITEASTLYSADGKELGTYFQERRTPVTYREISPRIVRTLVNTEDERFYEHHGIDFAGLAAAVKDMFRGRARGASTLTQQLAKNLFKVRRADGKYSQGLLGKIPGVRMLIIKIKEWIVAVKLEMVYDKEEIVTMYLNTVDYGNNAYGIKTACQSYFGTTPHELTYEQAATLVGLLKATSTYNPRSKPEKSMERRNVVLDNLYDHNQMIINGLPATKQQLDSIKALPIVTIPLEEKTNDDSAAPYFRKAIEDYVDKLCETGQIPGYDRENKINLYTDGMKVYTTVDSRMQKYAEDAVTKHMKEVQRKFNNEWGSWDGKDQPWRDSRGNVIPNFVEDLAKKTKEYKYLAEKFGEGSDSIDYYLNVKHPVTVFSYDGPKDLQLSVMDSIRYMVRFMHCGFVAIEPDTRHVKAWVGDVDYGSWQYDKVTTMRQPGSTFKLFVYTEAMNQGKNPCDTMRDDRVTYPDKVDGRDTTWTPRNANGSYSGACMPLKSAFARSVNSIAVKLGVRCGIHRVAETAHAMGIESPLQETNAMCLGASDVNLLELVNAYCTPVNDGLYSAPIMVTRIEDHNGNVIYEAQQKETQAIPYRSAFLMQRMLMGGMHGTSAALYDYIDEVQNTGTSFGGKTGTTNNHSDAWYVGVTPGLVAGVWVGGEYRSIHFRSGAEGQGSRAALPVFGRFIRSVLKDKQFTKYRRRFADSPRESIDEACWDCGEYTEAPDTTEVDTIETVIVDTLGNIETEPLTQPSEAT